jgi:hypothetical protein
MSEPAFEENDMSGLGGICHVRAICGPGVCSLGWGRHEFAQARILKFQARAARRRSDVIGPADKRKRVKMQAVGGMFGHDIDPQIGEKNPPFLQVHVELSGKSANMRGEFLLQRAERGREFMQLVQRGVGRVAAGIVFERPLAPGNIVVAEVAAFIDQIGIEALQVFLLEWLMVDIGRKPCAGWHVRSELTPSLKRNRNPLELRGKFTVGLN